MTNQPPPGRRAAPRRYGRRAGVGSAIGPGGSATESDYYFSFWTAFGWTILTCGIYAFYVAYQLVRRSRDHNARRIEMLDAATVVRVAAGRGEGRRRRAAAELQPHLGRAERLASAGDASSATRSSGRSSRSSGTGSCIIILYILLDGDLVTHDRAEGAIEHELSIIYTRLGAAVPAPEPVAPEAEAQLRRADRRDDLHVRHLLASGGSTT